MPQPTAALTALFLRGDLRQIVGPLFLGVFASLLLLTSPLVLFEFDRGDDLRFEALISALWLASLLLPIFLEHRLATRRDQVLSLLTRQPSSFSLASARWISLNVSVLVVLTPLVALCLILLPPASELGALWSHWGAGEIVGLWCLHTSLACSLTLAASGASSTAAPALLAATVVAAYLRPSGAASTFPWALLPDFPRYTPLLLGESGVRLESGDVAWHLTHLGAWALLSIAARSLTWNPRAGH